MLKQRGGLWYQNFNSESTSESPLHCVFILITALETAIWVQYSQILKTTFSYSTKGETFRGDSVNEMVKFNYFSTSVLLLRVTGLLI